MNQQLRINLLPIWGLLVWLCSSCEGSKVHAYLPADVWPTFDTTAPYLLNGPLWVGFDVESQAWRYLKIDQASPATPESRGLTDPGDPKYWKGNTGLFSQTLPELPQGTHLNMRWHPSMPANRHQVDDIMVKSGTSWVDKYESRLIDVAIAGKPRWIDDPELGGPPKVGENHPGNGFAVPPTWLAVSQVGQGSSGLSWFVAARAAANAGKRLITNEEWQVAAAGTARSNADGMRPEGETWEKVVDQDISAIGMVGCVGSLWEWTQAWGQYGQHYDGAAEPWLDWPGAGSFHEWDDRWSGYGDDYLINVAGRAFTRQDSARYATGLPAALVRGGSWGDHHRAGVFAVIADGAPSYFGKEVGFRCAK